MSKHHYIVILAGGSGTRLWPVSRRARPKHLHKIFGDQTLLQQTYARALKIVPKSQIYISTCEDLAEEVLNQIPINKDFLIIETASRNTAPAIGLAAYSLYQQDKKAKMATLASDHLIQRESEFAKVISAAFGALEKNLSHLVTVGIRPTRPETAFGYIEAGELHSQHKDGVDILRVVSFKEKPDPKTARNYLISGRYFWNASYFIFSAKTLLDWYKKHLPEAHKVLAKIDKKNIKKLYSKITSEPFDTAIVEKLDKVLVIPANIGWSDVGSWEVIHEILSDTTGSHLVVQGENIDVGSQRVLVRGCHKPIATVGLKDVVIIDTPDVLLVLNRKRSQDVKKVVEKLKKLNKKEYL